MPDVKKVSLSFPANTVGYDTVIGSGILNSVKNHFDFGKYGRVAILTDENVVEHYLEQARSGVGVQSESIVIKAGESEKSLATIENIWKQMFELGMDRNSLLVNLGGGVVGDLGGFAASSYMRGIDFINIPTTLLAAADASIGGKTGFNFASHKNIIGSFAQPKAVIVDVDSFETLDERTYNEGFAEIIKHAAVSDADYFKHLEEVLPTPTPEQLVDILETSCQIKASIVSADERESGERKKVNFGHTIGHAIESLSHEQGEVLLHGEAVAIGMVAEAKLGGQAGITEPGTPERLVSLLHKVNLPTDIPAWASQEKLDEKILRDKKNANSKVNWVVLTEIGSAKVDILLQ